MANKVGLIIALVVGIIMVGSLVAPIVSSYSEETLAYTNEGMPFAEVDEDTHTIVVTSSAITVDGEEIDQDLFPGSFTQYTLVYGSDGFVRYNTSDVRVEVRTSNGGGNFPLSSGETVTVSISGATATISSSDTSLSEVSFTATHYIASEGDYVMALNPVVQSDSAICGAGQTSFTAASLSLPASLYTYVTWSGTIGSVSATLLYYLPTSTYSSVTLDDAEVNTTDLGNGLYQIDSVLLNYTATDTDSVEYELTSTYTYFLAPAEVTYDNPDYIGSGAAAVLGAVVVMTLIALVLVAARGINRD